MKIENGLINIFIIRFTATCFQELTACCRRFGCLVVWSFGRLVVWSFGRLVVWSFGRLVAWSLGRLVVWLFGCLIAWLLGCLVAWSFGSSVVWSFGRLAVWSFGCLAVWLFGCLVVWLFGRLAVWPFGHLAVWLFGCLVVWSGSRPDCEPFSAPVSSGLYAVDWSPTVRSPINWHFMLLVCITGDGIPRTVSRLQYAIHSHSICRNGEESAEMAIIWKLTYIQ